MPTKIDVLDHGFVRLVSYMQPVPETTLTGVDDAGEMRLPPDPSWSGDLEIVRNARVSYNADWRKEGDDNARDGKSKDERLINYMYSHKHTSPFEAMVFTFEIKCPLFIARQWHRHRTWSYNEVSARYTELPNDFYVPDVQQITTQDAKNKQARTDEQHPRAEWMQALINEASAESHRRYQELLRSGCPRELARSVLPVNTYTRFFGTVDLHNLAHFIHLRADSHAQHEIQCYAFALLDLIRDVVPVTYKLIWEEVMADA